MGKSSYEDVIMKMYDRKIKKRPDQYGRTLKLFPGWTKVSFER